MVFFLSTKGTENMIKNWDELCDEEKSFNSWLDKNTNELNKINHTVLDLCKMIYMQGYAAGFHSKLQYSSEEYLQK